MFLNTVLIDLLTNVKRLAEEVEMVLIKINTIYTYTHAYISRFIHISIL